MRNKMSETSTMDNLELLYSTHLHQAIRLLLCLDPFCNQAFLLVVVLLLARLLYQQPILLE